MKTKIVTAISMLFLASSALYAADTIKSTASDQTSSAITVYNNDLGFVKEVRKVTLPAAQSTLEFMDVAAQIQPPTVHVKSLNDPNNFRVLEQNYEYDLISQEKILDKYVGKSVKLVNWREYQDRQDAVEATLLSNEGQVYQVGKEIYLGYPGYKVVPQLPDNLISKPTLMWLFESKKATEESLEVSYLTSGISWKADYVFVLDEKNEKSDLSGWVTIDNHSGATYKDSALKLIAGDVNRVEESNGRASKGARMMAMMAASEASFQEKSFFEYHLYDLQRKTTLKNNQIKQISLLEATGVSVEKEYRVDGIAGIYFQNDWAPETKQDVDVKIKFMNSKANALGMPLPGGILRVYQRETDGGQQFIGEDNLDHTPADEKVSVRIGKAFDIVAERTQTDFKGISSKIYETEWLVTLRNHKEEDVVVSVVEPFSSQWTITEKTHEFKKLGAFSAQFEVHVPKKGEAKLQYRVQIQTQ